LGIDDDYDVYRCSRCPLHRKREGAIGRKADVHHIGL